MLRMVYGQNDDERAAYVQEISTAFKPVAKVVVEFDCREERDSALERIDSLIYAVVRKE